MKDNGHDSQVDMSRLESYHAVEYTAAKNSYHNSTTLTSGSRSLDADDESRYTDSLKIFRLKT